MARHLKNPQAGTPPDATALDTSPKRPAATPGESGSHSDRIAELFRAHNESLVRYLAARLNSRQEALEVAQEAYVRMLKLEDPETVGFLRAFLFRTATNLAVDRLRADSRARHARETTIFAELVEVRTPERHAIGAEQLSRLRDGVASLPPKCRQAFLLYRVRGLAIEEVARQMGLTERMVHLYVRRALEHCEAMLKVADEHGPVDSERKDGRGSR